MTLYFANGCRFKIWIDAEESLRYKRRVNRDVMEREEKLTDVQIRYVNNVKPAYEEMHRNVGIMQILYIKIMALMPLMTFLD